MIPRAEDGSIVPEAFYASSAPRPDDADLAGRVRRLEARIWDLVRRFATERPNFRDLKDADLTKVADGQVAVYSSADGKWHPGSAGGGGGARFATLVAAPADAEAASLASADYVLTGTADQTILNTALDVLGTRGGGLLVILEGGLSISAPIEIPAGVAVRGMGNSGGTYIEGTVGFAGAQLVLMDGAGPRLSDVGLYNNSATATIDGIYVQGQQSIIERVLVYGALDRGIHIAGQWDRVQDCQIYGSGNDASFGVYSSSANSWIHNNQIDSVGIGVNLTGELNKVTGNTIRATRRDGIVVSGGTRSLIQGNSIFQPSKATHNTYDGIRIASGTRVSLLDNIVVAASSGNRGRYGIRIDASGADTIVAHNDLSGAGITASYSDAGSGTLTLGGNRT